ncbi:MAG TPA: hypothetical protein VI300_27835, partial [Solirubrobacter sp.]
AALSAWLRDRAWSVRAKEDRGCGASGSGCVPATRRIMDATFAGDVATLLAYPNTPRPLAAALVEVLGRFPGAEGLGLLRDARGREVAAIALPAESLDSPDQGVIAFDPDTGVLRAIGARRAGVIRWHRVYAIAAARVPTVGARP